MNKSYKLLLLLMGLLAVHAASASPARVSEKDRAMQMALLDLSRLEVVKQKRSAKPKQIETLPSNCLTWNVAQINRKASEFGKAINDYSRQYKIDSNLVKAVITAESCFKRKALSHKGARGLMQLIPDTAKRFGVKNSYDPRQNIRGGVKYLRFLFDRYKGDLKKIIAAYNAGEGKVDRYKGIPPYKETKKYVKNVLLTYDKLRAPLLAKNKTKKKRVHHVYKPGRGGWKLNRARAPHLYKH